MAPNEQGALIARSKCYIALGEPEKALADAETALSNDKNSIRAIYQKAEALYYLGKFEHSLMFFHRGLRLRPELANFRLGKLSACRKNAKILPETILTSKRYKAFLK
jgi:tetratricopeptide repeat protein 25